MSDEEQTNQSNDVGKKPDTSNKEDEKPVSIVDEARGLRDDIRREKEELKVENDRKQKLQAEEMLSSTGGGHVESKQVSEKDKKAADAAKYFEGTQLEKDIKKANE